MSSTSGVEAGEGPGPGAFEENQVMAQQGAGEAPAEAAGDLKACWQLAATVQFCRLFGQALKLNSFSTDLLEGALLQPASHQVGHRGGSMMAPGARRRPPGGAGGLPDGAGAARLTPRAVRLPSALRNARRARRPPLPA